MLSGLSGALSGLSGALNGLSGALSGLSGLAASTSAAGVLVGAEVAVGGGVLVGAGTGVAVAGGGWVGVGVGSLPPHAAEIAATIKIVNNRPTIHTRWRTISQTFLDSSHLVRLGKHNGLQARTKRS